MKFLRTRTGFALSCLLLLLPIQVLAQENIMIGILGKIAPSLISAPPTVGIPCIGVGVCGLINMADYVVVRFRPLVIMLAGLMLLIHGYRIIIAQEDDVSGKSKTIVTASVSGVVLMYLYRPFVQSFYGVQGSVFNTVGGPALGHFQLSQELDGIINWSLMIVASLAVVMIILSGVQAIAASGSEDGVEKMRKTVISVASGILVLTLRPAINRMFGLALPREGSSPVTTRTNPLAIIDAGVSVLKFFLSFAGLAAFIVVIYAGILMILNLGNEERVTQAKGMLYRAGIGLIIIMVSLGLVSFVIQSA